MNRTKTKLPPPASGNTTPVRPRVLFQRDDSSVTSTTSNTPRKTADEAEHHLWKQVAEDIESAGGISLFAGSGHKLSALLNKKNNPLYDRGQDKKLRKRIQSHVYRWQQWNKEGTYEKKVLAQYKVKSALVRRQEAEAKARVTKRKRQPILNQDTTTTASPKKTPHRLRPGSGSSTSSSLVGEAIDDDDSSLSTTFSSPPLDEESGSDSSYSSIHRGAQEKRTKKSMRRSKASSSSVQNLASKVAEGLTIESPRKKSRLPPVVPPQTGKRKDSPLKEKEKKDIEIISPTTATGRLLPQKFKPRSMKGVSGGKKLPPGTGTISRCCCCCLRGAFLTINSTPPSYSSCVVLSRNYSCGYGVSRKTQCLCSNLQHS
jgi:hypothetical protein